MLLFVALAAAVWLPGPARLGAAARSTGRQDARDGYVDGDPSLQYAGGWRQRLVVGLSGISTQTVLDARVSGEVGALMTQLCSADSIRAAARNAQAAIRGALLAEPLNPGVEKGPAAVAMSRMVREPCRVSPVGLPPNDAPAACNGRCDAIWN